MECQEKAIEAHHTGNVDCWTIDGLPDMLDQGELDEFSGRAGVSIFSKFSTMSFLQARDPNCAAMLDVRPAEGLGAGHCCVEGRDRDEPCFRRVPRVQSANGELGVSPVFTDWS